MSTKMYDDQDSAKEILYVSESIFQTRNKSKVSNNKLNRSALKTLTGLSKYKIEMPNIEFVNSAGNDNRDNSNALERQQTMFN